MKIDQFCRSIRGVEKAHALLKNENVKLSVIRPAGQRWQARLTSENGTAVFTGPPEQDLVTPVEKELKAIQPKLAHVGEQATVLAKELGALIAEIEAEGTKV